VTENADITRPLYDAINAIPYCVAHRLHSGKVKVRRGWMQLEPKGTPDVLALLRNGPMQMHWPVYFETKALDGEERASQVKRHRELRAIGFRVEVPRSLPEAMAVVREVLEARR
jgi:hypothetical protein